MTRASDKGMSVDNTGMTTNLTPPFGPVLLAALPARVLPLRPLQAGLGRLMALMHGRHQGVFERLSQISDPHFLIDPTDLPLVFVLNANSSAPRSVARRRGTAIQSPPATATIRGPFLGLIALLEGRIDGDALFFSRELSVEGNTEAIVALRNAVDSAEVDVLGDIMAALGPLAPLARRALGLAGTAFARATIDLNQLQAALLRPVELRMEAFERRQQAFDDRTDPAGRPNGRRRRTA